MISSHLIALLLAALGAAASPTPSAPPAADVSNEAVFDVLGFDAHDRARVLAGEIVTRGFEETTEKELSVSMAMVVDAPIDRLVADLSGGRLLEHDRQLQSYGIIKDTKAPDPDLQGLRFAPDEANEIDRLFGARPGSQFNLDVGEYAGFDALRRRFPTGGCGRNPECAEAVVSEYRRILGTRLAAYVDRGLDGIAPYAREGGKSSAPGQELKSAAQGLRPVTQRSQQLFQAFLNYPRGDTTVFEHQFLWLKQIVQDRPTVILSHRVRHVEPTFALLAERQLYVGHSYNALQVFAGLLPFEGKTIVFYLNRTSTDQVAGVMRDLRHSAGRSMMAKQLREHFEGLRKLR